MAEGRAALIHRQGEVEQVRVADADRCSVLSRLSLNSHNSRRFSLDNVIGSVCSGCGGVTGVRARPAAVFADHLAGARLAGGLRFYS